MRGSRTQPRKDYATKTTLVILKLSKQKWNYHLADRTKETSNKIVLDLYDMGFCLAASRCGNNRTMPWLWDHGKGWPSHKAIGLQRHLYPVYNSLYLRHQRRLTPLYFHHASIAKWPIKTHPLYSFSLLLRVHPQYDYDVTLTFSIHMHVIAIDSEIGHTSKDSYNLHLHPLPKIQGTMKREIA